MPQPVSGRPLLLLRLALAFVPFLLHFPAQAQTGSVPASPAEVTLDLTAHDRKGNAVLDLEPSEVQIIDGVAPVSLKSLRLVSAAQVPETVTMIFDQVVSGVANTDRGLAEELLTAASGHGYLFTVFKVEGRLHLLQAPTPDVALVKNAIDAATVAKRPDYIRLTEAAEKQVSEDMQTAPGPRQASAKMLMAMLMDSQNTARDPQSTSSVAALLAASRGQQDVPGRKSILYFSQGLEWHSSSPETVRDIAQAANRARVSIYSFDAAIGDEQAANALIVSSALGTSQAMGGIASGSLSQGRNASPSADAPGSGISSGENSGRLQSGDRAGNRPPLVGLCETTGGAHVSALSEGRKGVREIAADLKSYYVASWISPGAAADNRLRPIRVKASRDGVFIQSRSGYYLAHSGSAEMVSAVERRMIEALTASTLPADLPLNAAVLRFGNTPDNDLNSVVVQAPADAVSVLAQLKDKPGAVVRKFSADIPRRGPLGAQEQSSQEVTTFRRQFSAPPGEYVLESVAINASGGIAARRDDVVIPAVTQGLALGDVVLVRSIDPAGASDGADPLRCAEGIVVPNLSGHVSKAVSPKITLFFNLHTDPGSADAPSLSAELRRDSVSIGSVPLKLTPDPKRQTIPYLTTLGAGTLRAGRYQLTVILSQGGQKVSESVSFTLE